MTRHRLPNRRPSDLYSFRHEGIAYRGCVSTYPDGRIGEVFLDPDVRSGTGVETAARDIAVAASLALQHGCPLEELRAALTRLHDSSAAGPLGILLDLVAGGSPPADTAVRPIWPVGPAPVAAEVPA